MRGKARTLALEELRRSTGRHREKPSPVRGKAIIYIIMYIETDYRCITLALISLVLPTFQKFSPK